MTTRDLVGRRVVAVHAHPDAEASTTGGTLFDLARRGAETLWELIEQNTADPEHWVRALGALTGNQAVQQVRA